ncbi:serine hydrolase domain-containing protein [Nocardia bhagyanarayanae]|uniref:D-alanyl-D-alanine carboxypeptidase n=1 Tax=Nocardia bhagyanarayanae TaxID=1215925 RepID=A0A543F5W3_9NOCA|nr:serine hydrolase domain-containing protein [Nocardia bhagyanarayanae]TQM29199.1 D-alanyl-D-alanine carboxypeptidase [Nocardia bhagyanarayanae]
MTVFRRHTAAAGICLVALFGAQACGDTAPSDDDRTAAIQRALDATVRGGFPGAQAVLTTDAGDRTVTAGVGDIATGAPIPADARVRIGSNTKTFVATVVLQLVAEGKVELDAPVERYLPGVVRGNGNDGNRVTVRQLLQHTSGLPDYLAGGDPELRAEHGTRQLEVDTEAVRLRRYDAAELVRLAMTMPPRYEPGARAVYTNTNYVLLGMLIQQTTGRTAADEITARIIEPLGLRDTWFPAQGETGIRGPHPVGYHQIDGARVDFTQLDPSWADAAGAMISTGADLNRFFGALLDGRLLPAAQLDEMRRTVPFDRMPGAGYGLGLIQLPSSCGKEVWGHGGSIPGFGTRNGVTADGHAVTVIVNQLPTSEENAVLVQQAFDAAVCAA